MRWLRACVAAAQNDGKGCVGDDDEDALGGHRYLLIGEVAYGASRHAERRPCPRTARARDAKESGAAGGGESERSSSIPPSCARFFARVRLTANLPLRMTGRKRVRD